MRTHTRTALAAATALTLALATTACGSNSTASDDATGPTNAVDETSAIVTFDDGWAKATDSPMSGVFGTIRNPGEADVLLSGVSGELGGATELHETVPGGSGMMMQEKEDGFLVPAGGELVLEPGGNHIMLMELERPITTGQEITLTLEFDGGTAAGGTEQDVTVSARDFSGGEEEYVGDGDGHGAGADAADGGASQGMSHDG